MECNPTGVIHPPVGQPASQRTNDKRTNVSLSDSASFVWRCACWWDGFSFLSFLSFCSSGGILFYDISRVHLLKYARASPLFSSFIFSIWDYFDRFFFFLVYSLVLYV